VKHAEGGIVLEQVRERSGICQVVGGDEFYVRIMQSGSDDISSNAAETINTYFYGHDAFSLADQVSNSQGNLLDLGQVIEVVAAHGF
jgi:hypothetical protein